MAFKAGLANYEKQQAMNELLRIIHTEPEFKELKNRFQHKRKGKQHAIAFDEAKENKPMATDVTEMSEAQLLKRWDRMLGPDEPEEEVTGEVFKREMLTAFDGMTFNQQQRFKSGLKVWAEELEQRAEQQEWQAENQRCQSIENKYKTAMYQRNKRY
jgi:hypothetical protein